MIGSKEICLINLYGPNKDDHLFFEIISQNLHGLTSDHIIMVGDYNTVLNTSLDRKGNQSSNYHPHACKEILNIMNTFDLIDVWRLKYPDLPRYTWRRANQASRIDYFLISFSIVPKVNKVLTGD